MNVFFRAVTLPYLFCNPSIHPHRGYFFFFNTAVQSYLDNQIYNSNSGIMRVFGFRNCVYFKRGLPISLSQKEVTCV